MKKTYLLSVMVITVLFFSKCLSDTVSPDPRGRGYAGSAECVRCHPSISASYTHTAHFLSTRVADKFSISGSFSKDSNVLLIDDTTRIVMEKRDSGFYQVLYINNKQSSAHRFDLVMGEAKGQSYIYWQEGRFFQLPVSFYTSLHQWTTSPGYSIHNLHFNRPVIEECFECHSSFVDLSPAGLSWDARQQNGFILNIDCERCHGPAADHISFHDAHPESTKSEFTMSFRSISRQRRVDLCATCHSGTKHNLLKQTFKFKMGDTLASYMNVFPPDIGPIDVHGNQTQLLSQSKCFRMSEMDCTTCHDVHVNQRGLTKSFNARCESCHAPGRHFCKLATDANRGVIENNCTGCHMPAQTSRAIVVQRANNIPSVSNLAVNHRIAIYPEETIRILKLKDSAIIRK